MNALIDLLSHGSARTCIDFAILGAADALHGFQPHFLLTTKPDADTRWTQLAWALERSYRLGHALGLDIAELTKPPEKERIL